MYNLSCADGFRYPGQDEVYVLDLIPLLQGPATISSDQKLCLFNPMNLRVGPVNTLQTSHGNITCAKAFDLGSSIVATAGENGSISMWDLRQDARQSEVARLTGRVVSEVAINHIDHHFQTTMSLFYRLLVQVQAIPSLQALNWNIVKHPY